MSTRSRSRCAGGAARSIANSVSTSSGQAAGQLPNRDFNHASVITLLSPAGEIAVQSTVLGKADGALLASLAAP